MVELFNKKFSKRELLSRMGDIAQLANVQECIIHDSNGNGVKAVIFRTGSGLNFTVLPGRGMDIAYCDYKGIPVSWMSHSGIVSPMYYEEPKAGWLRNFFGGLLTTCGMTYCGADCVDNGEELGVHGRVSNYTAEDVGISREWAEDQYLMSVRGKVRQAALYKENLMLSRKISTGLGEKVIRISDSIENLGFEPQPLMMLYHINLGWPIVSEDSRLAASVKKTIPRSEQKEAEREANLFAEFTEPQKRYEERCYYHHLNGSTDGVTYAVLINDKLKVGVYVKYNLNQLFNLVEWKQLREGIYAVGIEPSNCYLEGRNKSREDGTLQFIKPGETKKFDIEIGILDGKAEIEEMEKLIQSF